MKYFYAYHGPKNTKDFDYSNGYGVGQEWKTRQVTPGDRLFVIQKLSGKRDFQLCGVFEIIDTFVDPNNVYPYRVQLKEEWTNFKRHFCHQGASFEAPLCEEIVSVLSLLIAIPDYQIGTPARREDGLRMVKIRREQAKFRKAVMSNWGNKCAITGSILAVEACHIISHANKGLPSVENGIALAADFHKLFDSDHLSFRDNRVILSESARLEPRYKDFHGTELRKPLKPVDLSVK